MKRQLKTKNLLHFYFTASLSTYLIRYLFLPHISILIKNQQYFRILYTYLKQFKFIDVIKSLSKPKALGVKIYFHLLSL